jgi:hypothetical protein
VDADESASRTEVGAGKKGQAQLKPPENAVEFGRRPSKPPSVLPASAAPVSGTATADTDPWTVPQSVRDRFVQDGHRFYFPDGYPAFRDRGRRLTTVSENTQVVASLIEIAKSRGWAEATVTGTERFREEAWRQARLAGLNVRGFRPNDEQQAVLVRTLARGRARPSDGIDGVTDASSPAPSPVSQPVRARNSEPTRITGQLLKHGKDAYRHDPREGPSYFVKLKTPAGEREIWGRDLQRAVSKAITQPKVGDQVVLQRTGQQSVSVKKRVSGMDGQSLERVVETQRNRWVIEKREFFEARSIAAAIVRNETADAREAVRLYPELAGTYLSVRAAQLAAKALRDPEDQTKFVRHVRQALALSVERGEPLPLVRLRSHLAASRTIFQDPPTR